MAHLPQDPTDVQGLSEDSSPARTAQTRANTIDLFLPLLGDPPDHVGESDQATRVETRKGKGFGPTIAQSDSSPVYAMASGSEWGDDQAKGFVDSPGASPRMRDDMCPTHLEPGAEMACGAESAEVRLPKDTEMQNPSSAPAPK